MQVRDAMTTDVQMVPAEAPVQDAAAKMQELDVGALPVWDGEQVVGILTDRDITVRATAAGEDPTQTTVAEVMTPEILYCYEDADLEEATGVMAERQIRRLAVLNHEDQMVGMLSLGDVALEGGGEVAGEALEDISEPGAGG